MELEPKSLIVVSNRLPVSITSVDDQWEVHLSSGGLASALNGAQKEIPFTWVGWPGASFFPHQKEEITQALAPKKLVPIFINKEQEEHYYHAICNSYLWPLFHYFTEQLSLFNESWRFYEEVNQIFADKILEIADQNATIWIHDFHLMLVPKMLKEKRPDLKIGFFLHIPFPSSEIYRMLPKRKDLLLGVLGSDYLGFHTVDYSKHFKSACQRILGISTQGDCFSHEGRQIKVGTHPIGMNISSFDEILSKPNYFSYIQEIKTSYSDYRVLLGIERLDYTKGIFFKLQAFETLLENNPDLIGKLILLQVIVPCRLDSPEYQRHRSEIEKMVSRINGKYSRPGYNPIHYMYRSLPLSELIALYCMADICLITSIRDGMNLVAQEYVYCAERAKTSGALLLSEFAGAAHHLTRATLINPFDIQGMVKAIENTLALSPQKRQRHLEQMKKTIELLDSPKWARHFLDELEEFCAQSQHHNTSYLSLDEKGSIFAKAEQSKSRTLILDYDGTLREMMSHPMEATPTKEILSLLEHLSELPHTEVHLVSGRDAQTLQAWFGHLDLHLSAEHGYLSCPRSTNQWKPTQETDLSWMPYVRELLNRAVEEVPGSFLEIKKSVLTWHYRLADPTYSKWRANELYSTLLQDLAHLPVEIIPGKQIIEVRAQGVSKGNYLKEVLKNSEPSPFILCIGDDRTDQEMQKCLPNGGIFIYVGQGAQASYYLKSPACVREFLSELYAAISMKDSPALDQ